VDLTKLDLEAEAVSLLPQTRRHALLARLLRVPHIVFAVNKLDAVADPARAFGTVRQALLRFAGEAGITPAGIVPVSALRGDNITRPIEADWYQGPTLLQLLEDLPDATARPAGLAGTPPLVLPVQYVARDAGPARGAAPPGEQPRVYWGRIGQGRVAVGDEVQVFPSRERARVAALRHAGRSVDHLDAGSSAGVVLDRQLDISRGDWLATPGTLRASSRFTATLAWLDTEPAQPGRRYWVRHGNRWVQARIAQIDHRLDIHTLEPTDAHELAVNDIGRVTVELQQVLPLQAFADSGTAGALIVVDPATHRTSGALLVQAIQ
jgi:sulfate adenylyltransferase subunit 1